MAVAHFFQLQQARARRNQQADAQLDGRDIFDEILLGDDREQVAIAGERGPRRERHERGLQDQPQFAETRDDGQKIGARVALFQARQDGVVDRLDGAGDEQAAGIAQLAQSVRVAAAGARS